MKKGRQKEKGDEFLESNHERLERLERLKQTTSFCEEDHQWVIGLAEKAVHYENLLCAIANVDTIFINADGSERPWDDKEALRVIDENTQPVWQEVCERTRIENEKNRP